MPSDKYGDRITRLLTDIQRDYGADVLAHWLLSLALTTTRELYGEAYLAHIYKDLMEKLKDYDLNIN